MHRPTLTPYDPVWIEGILSMFLDLAVKAELPLANSPLVSVLKNRRLIPEYTEIPNETLVHLRSCSSKDHCAWLVGQLRGMNEEQAAIMVHRILEAAYCIAGMSESRDGTTLIEVSERDWLHKLNAALAGFCKPPAGCLGLPPLPAYTPATTLSPADWAAGWTDAMASKTFGMVRQFIEYHVQQETRGLGILDDCRTLTDVPDPQTPVIDRGILIFPKCWAEREFILIGDLHGDRPALDAALGKVGIHRTDVPEGKVILFLGDYGDRSEGSLAVWLRVIELKCAHPDRVHLLRGNHEETVAVHPVREDNGNKIDMLLHLPRTAQRESLTALTFILEGVSGNAAFVFEKMPNLAILPGGCIAVHGCLPPRAHGKDGWPLTPDAREPLALETIADLRKPVLASIMRWTDFCDRRNSTFGWAEFGRSGRLTFDLDDLAHYREKWGDFALIHGHTHPYEGAKSEDDGKAAALGTFRHSTQSLGIARWHQSRLSLEAFTL